MTTFRSDTRILLTGANGFAGAYILRALFREGYSNIAVCLRAHSDTAMISSFLDRVDIFQTSIHDTGGMEEAITGAEIIIHVAGKVSFSSGDKREMMKSNVEGTALLVDLALESNVQKFIHISSVAALGRSASDIQLDEKSNWVKSKLNTYYAISKHQGEMEVWRGVFEGLPAVIINPSTLIGAGYWHKGTCRFFPQVYRGLSHYPVGSNGFTDVRDLADMVCAVLNNPISGERLICNGVNLSYRELFTRMAMFMGVKSANREMSPAWAGLVWRYFHFMEYLTGRPAPVTRETMKTVNHRFAYSNNRSIDNIGFVYRDFEKTLKESGEAYLRSRKEKKDFAWLEDDR